MHCFELGVIQGCLRFHYSLVELSLLSSTETWYGKKSNHPRKTVVIDQFINKHFIRYENQCLFIPAMKPYNRITRIKQCINGEILKHVCKIKCNEVLLVFFFYLKTMKRLNEVKT